MASDIERWTRRDPMMQIHIHLSPDRDADLIAAWDRLAAGDRSQAGRDALRLAWCEMPTLARALDHLAQAIEKLEPGGKAAESPPATPPKPDMAARRAALLGPFQAR